MTNQYANSSLPALARSIVTASGKGLDDIREAISAKGREVIELIYIGRQFYEKSGTRMGSLYTLDWERWDWGGVAKLLDKHEVSIRPATEKELDVAFSILGKILAAKD